MPELKNSNFTDEHFNNLYNAVNNELSQMFNHPGRLAWGEPIGGVAAEILGEALEKLRMLNRIK